MRVEIGTFQRAPDVAVVQRIEREGQPAEVGDVVGLEVDRDFRPFAVGKNGRFDKPFSVIQHGIFQRTVLIHQPRIPFQPETEIHIIAEVDVLVIRIDVDEEGREPTRDVGERNLGRGFAVIRSGSIQRNAVLRLYRHILVVFQRNLLFAQFAVEVYQLSFLGFHTGHRQIVTEHIQHFRAVHRIQLIQPGGKQLRFFDDRRVLFILCRENCLNRLLNHFHRRFFFGTVDVEADTGRSRVIPFVHDRFQRVPAGSRESNACGKRFRLSVIFHLVNIAEPRIGCGIRFESRKVQRVAEVISLFRRERGIDRHIVHRNDSVHRRNVRIEFVGIVPNRSPFVAAVLGVEPDFQLAEVGDPVRAEIDSHFRPLARRQHGRLNESLAVVKHRIFHRSVRLVRIPFEIEPDVRITAQIRRSGQSERDVEGTAPGFLSAVHVVKPDLGRGLAVVRRFGIDKDVFLGGHGGFRILSCHKGSRNLRGAESRIEVHKFVAFRFERGVVGEIHRRIVTEHIDRFAAFHLTDKIQPVGEQGRVGNHPGVRHIRRRHDPFHFLFNDFQRGKHRKGDAAFAEIALAGRVGAGGHGVDAVFLRRNDAALRHEHIPRRIGHGEFKTRVRRGSAGRSHSRQVHRSALVVSFRKALGDRDVRQLSGHIDVFDIVVEFRLGRVVGIVAEIEEQDLARSDVVISADEQVEVQRHRRPDVVSDQVQPGLLVPRGVPFLVGSIGPLMIQVSRLGVFEVQIHRDGVKARFLQFLDRFERNSRRQGQAGIFGIRARRIGAGHLIRRHPADFRGFARQRFAVIGFGTDAERRVFVREVLDFSGVRLIPDDKVRHRRAFVSGRVDGRRHQRVSAPFVQAEIGFDVGKHHRVALFHFHRRRQPGVEIVRHFDFRKSDRLPDHIALFHAFHGYLGLVGVHDFERGFLLLIFLLADDDRKRDQIIGAPVNSDLSADDGNGVVSVRDDILHRVQLAVLIFDDIDGNRIDGTVRNFRLRGHVKAGENQLAVIATRFYFARTRRHQQAGNREQNRRQPSEEFLCHCFSPFHYFFVLLCPSIFALSCFISSCFFLS